MNKKPRFIPDPSSGGKANVKKHGAKRMREIASLGGKAVLKKYGRKHFSAAGRKGGSVPRVPADEREWTG